MKLTFTVETGQPDCNGDVIKLDGVKVPVKVSMVEEFDPEKKIGEAEIKREGDLLKATAEVPDHLLDKYPAIGFSVRKYHVEDKGRVFEEIDLRWLGLCKRENLNPDIKTIREQTEGQ